MDDRERSQWVDNDEGLYGTWCESRMSKAAFVKANRDRLTRYIEYRG